MTDTRHRYHEIDLLRGLACAAVVAYHYLSRGPRAGWMDNALFPLADAIARYGYLGVHLFFIISGFVILLSAEGASPRGFVASRVARLYPAFWTAAAITAIAVWLLGDGRFAVSVAHFLVKLTMLAHWFNVPWVDGAYWSLAVELHFYLYVWLALRLGLFHRIEWLLTAWLLVSAINAVRPMWPVEFWLNAKWAPFFIAGGAFFLIRSRGITPARIGLLLAAYGLALLYAVRETAIGVTPGFFRPDIVAGIVTVFFAVFAAIALKRWTVSDSRIVSLLGALTYPVYLLHQNLGYVVYQRLAAISGNALIGLAATTMIVVGLAWAIHRRVEKTMGPKVKRLVAHPARSGDPDESKCRSSEVT